MHSVKNFLAWGALAAVSGCAAVTPIVQPVGEGAFQLSTTGSRYESQADTNLKAITAAHDYCAGMGKNLLFRGSIESSEHDWSPKREDLTFVCMDAKDPAYMQAGLRRETTVVAQQ
jgi:hypothetical protein